MNRFGVAARRLGVFQAARETRFFIYQSRAASTSTSNEDNPTEYRKERFEKLSEVVGSRDTWYPYFTPLSHESIGKLRQEFDHLKNGEQSSQKVTIAGRIMSKRESSKHLVFLDIEGYEGSVQIMASEKLYHDPKEFSAIITTIKRGDIVSIEGIPKRAQRGELSVVPQKISLLSPCFYPLPQNELMNKEIRYRNRHFDLLLNDQVKEYFKKRSTIIKTIRQSLDTRGFLEVETPILSPQCGGANARPFSTVSVIDKRPMYLRIAPELPLKKLVVGGFLRVYEISKQFRNEGIDATHNPEFTTCEFYQAYSDFAEMMHTVESILKEVVAKTHPNMQVKLPGTDHVIDFSKKFEKKSIVEELERLASRKLPELTSSFDDVDEHIFKLENLCHELRVYPGKIRTPTKIIDTLIGALIEPTCIQPTFLYHHPALMCPLAKRNKTNPALSDRFELFIGGKEFCNAYSELNDPFDQYERFKEQAKDREHGDDEAQVMDLDYCKSLLFSLPPTAGCGIGVDRLVMLLCEVSNMKEVLLFPMMGPEETEEENPFEERKLEQAIRSYHPQTKVLVSWSPFFLNENTPPEGYDLKDYLSRKYGRAVDLSSPSNPVNLAGREVGISFNANRRIVNTVNAHRLIEFAKSQGKEDDVVEGIFHAYFVEASDISKTEVLEHIAEKSHLSGAKSFLQSDELRQQVVDSAHQAAVEGVHAVPHTVIYRNDLPNSKKYSFSGAQSPDTIGLYLNKALAFQASQ